MKEKHLLLVLLAIIMIVMLVACAYDGYSEPVQNNANRFQPTGQTFGMGSVVFHVYKDTETLYLYLVSDDGHEGGICLWLDKNGQPMKAER